MIALRNKHLLNCLKPKIQNFVKYVHNDYQEIRIPVPWGHIAGKWWGSTDRRPVLALHGWQDNCGSFNRLIPLLNRDVGFLAIDLPGHGYSSRIPSGLYYHSVEHIILIQYIVNYFKWPQVSLMSHSMGGATSFMYTMIHPKNVDFLICIDFAKPMFAEGNMARIASIISTFPKLAHFEISDREPPSYTMEEIEQKVCAPNENSISYEHCHHVIERNVAPSEVSPGKYYFTRDSRVKAGELMNWLQKETVAMARNITCPVLIAKAISAPYYVGKKNFYEVLDILKESSIDCQYYRVDGTHHVHLNNPEILADLIRKFIAKHNTQRNIGGIRREIIQ